MRKVIQRNLLACVAAIGFAGSASAADLMPLKASPAPYWNWGGFYAGIHGGYGWGDVSNTGGSADIDGGFAGAQVGFNIQRGNIVWGVELDSAWANIGRSDNAAIGGVALSANTNIDYMGSLRGRVGYAPGNALYYVTGGAAWAHGSLDLTAASGGFAIGASADNTHLGWTLGAGAEWMVQPNWSVKLEYLYTDYGSETYFGVPVDAQVSTVKLGLNYFFR